MSLKYGDKTITDIYWGTVRITKRLQNEKVLYEYQKPDDHRFRFYNPGPNKCHIRLDEEGSISAPPLEYSTDNGVTWTLGLFDVILEPKATVYVRGFDYTASRFYEADNRYCYFWSNYPVECHGNIMDLVGGKLEMTVENQFGYLFKNMTKLLTAPTLNTTTLTTNGFNHTFEGCTSLISIPDFPDEILPGSASFVYYYTFSGCSSLTEVPKLPRSGVSNGMYFCMFYNCTSLKSVHLTSNNVGYAYQEMFMGCSNLSRVEVEETTWNNSNNWLSGVASTGVFVKPAKLTNIPLNSPSGIPSGWTVVDARTPEDGFRFKNVSGQPNTLKLTKYNNAPQVTLEKSSNGVVYEPCNIYSGITLQPDETIYLKGINDTFAVAGGYNYFTSTGNVECYGSVMDLCDGGVGTFELKSARQFYHLFKSMTTLITAPELLATTLTEFCYDGLFDGCTALTQAPVLPATELVSGCYNSMFKKCTSLTQAPILPATALTQGCYISMFEGCTALTQAPVLPATTLADGCYSWMFGGCTSLTQAPVLPAKYLVDDCYKDMFDGCTALTQAPELPVTELASGCYNSMFSGCTSLTQAPELPATALAPYCYSGMFSGCTSLTQAPVLPATTLIDYCYSRMFSGCTALTQAPELPATTLIDYCYEYMFSGCTLLTKSPVLPATGLVSGCYSNMFNGCTLLNYVEVLATSWSYDYYEWFHWTEDWLAGVAPTGTFVKSKELQTGEGDGLIPIDSASGIPSGWVINEGGPVNYKESFDGISSGPDVIPEGWKFIRNATSGSGSISIKNSGAYSSPNCIYSIADDSNGECYAILPDFGKDIKSLKISFWNKIENTYSSYKMDLGYMDGGEEARFFVKIISIPESIAWKSYSYDLSSMTIPGSGRGRLAFKWYNGNSTNYYTWTDDISVEEV